MTNMPSKLNKKCKYTAAEDQVLINLVEKYGEHNWETIASLMPNRNSRQCHDRWIYYLSPNVNTAPWTDEEEKFLLKCILRYGKKWTKISKLFNGRNDIQIKNKWNNLKKNLTEDHIKIPHEKTLKKAKLVSKPITEVQKTDEKENIHDNTPIINFNFIDELVFNDFENTYFF